MRKQIEKKSSHRMVAVACPSAAASNDCCRIWRQIEYVCSVVSIWRQILTALQDLASDSAASPKSGARSSDSFIFVCMTGEESVTAYCK
jgi:hypothetical protein